MRVTFAQDNSETPSSDYLQEDKDCADKQYELKLEDAILLLQRLRSSRGRISFKSENCTTHVTLAPEELMSVEISCVTAFWAISEVSDSEAESIIRTLYGGEDFGELIPGTKREWDAWGDGT